MTLTDTPDEHGGPAFPVKDFRNGMSLRDWFAGSAMRALLADPLFDSNVTPDFIADRAYVQAEAMLKRRAQS